MRVLNNKIVVEMAFQKDESGRYFIPFTEEENRSIDLACKSAVGQGHKGHAFYAPKEIADAMTEEFASGALSSLASKKKLLYEATADPGLKKQYLDAAISHQAKCAALTVGFFELFELASLLDLARKGSEARDIYRQFLGEAKTDLAKLKKSKKTSTAEPGALEIDLAEKIAFAQEKVGKTSWLKNLFCF